MYTLHTTQVLHYTLFYRNCSRIADAMIRVCWPKFQSTCTCKYDVKGNAVQLEVTEITPSGQYLVVQLPSSSTGYDLGSHISTLCGVPVEQQLLFCNNKRIDPYKSLQMQNVVNNPSITFSQRIVRNQRQLLQIMYTYTAAATTFSLAFYHTCGYQHSLHALVKSPAATVLHISQDSLQRFWVFASPTVVNVPVLKTRTVCLQPPLCSTSAMLRLLTALQWLLIVAGDMELNPGPISQGET